MNNSLKLNLERYLRHGRIKYESVSLEQLGVQMVAAVLGVVAFGTIKAAELSSDDMLSPW